MTLKTVFNFKLLPEECGWFNCVQIVEHPSEDAHTITLYTREGMSNLLFNLRFALKIAAELDNRLVLNPEDGNTPGSSRDHHVGLRHAEIGEADLAHSHMCFQGPVTLRDVEQFMSSFYKVQRDYIEGLAGGMRENFTKKTRLAECVGTKILEAYQKFLEEKLLLASASDNAEDINYLCDLGVLTAAPPSPMLQSDMVRSSDDRIRKGDLTSSGVAHTFFCQKAESSGTVAAPMTFNEYT